MQQLVRRHPVPAAAVAFVLILVMGTVLGAVVTPSGAQDETGSLAAPLAPAPPPRLGQADLMPFRGLGTWVDIYDSSYSHPRRAVAEMRRRGVRTLYLETANYTRSRPFVYRDRVAAFLDAADAYKIRTVAWYLPGFRDVQTDFQRSMAAIRFTTAAGNRFDAFALDIESPEVRDARTRTDRLLRLSSMLRNAVNADPSMGNAYALGAIVPSPYGVRHAGSYWPGFPWAELTGYYDVYLPMTYFTWKVKGERRTHWYTTACIKILRQDSTVPQFPIHVVGGIADEASAGETRGFLHAIRERGVLGGSYYTYPLTNGRQWRLLRRIPVNLPQDPVMPYAMSLGATPFGHMAADSSHPKEVVYTTGGKVGAWNVSYRAFDAQAQEITVMANWRVVGRVPAGPGHSWSALRTLTIPGSLLHDQATNVIQFVAAGNFPSWSTWGVRDVSLSSAA